MKKNHSYVPVLIGLFCLVPSIRCCFSSGSSNSESSSEPNASALVSKDVGVEERVNENSVVVENVTAVTAKNEDPIEEKIRLNDRFVKTYLKEFGYIKTQSIDGKKQLTREEWGTGIRRFQEFMRLFPPTRKMDLRSTSQMVRKRCSNPDLIHSEDLHPIWERSTIHWTLVNGELMNGIGERDLKELIRQAFSAWEIVISMDFIEVPFSNYSTADITFMLGEEEDDKGKSGMGVAYSTPPLNSTIFIRRNESWSTFQIQEEGKLDIFLVLIHQIGHTLGLRHSSEKSSVMYPIFERETGEQLPVISNDDVERLRQLYDPEENTEINSETNGNATTKSTKVNTTLDDEDSPSQNVEKCPKTLNAATQGPNGDLYVFDGGDCWQFARMSGLVVSSGPRRIGEIFPAGPDTVDVAITSQNLTVLIQERTLYGYHLDEESPKFKLAKGFPRQLHSRVLFYPEAAFPLSNGSVILIRDNVFATYDLISNEPTMLNDKQVYFPNLPEDLRAGIPHPDQPFLYWMLTAENNYVYDSMTKKILSEQTLHKFLGCGEENEDRIHQKTLGRKLEKKH